MKITNDSPVINMRVVTLMMGDQRTERGFLDFWRTPFFPKQLDLHGMGYFEGMSCGLK